MDKLRAAARALLAHWDTPAWKYLKPTGDLMADLREALAEQAEQEPVAWGYFDADGSFMDALDRQHGAYQTPLYAVPVRTKNLTDDEINEVLWRGGPFETVLDATRAVIAADREKNK